MGLCGRPGFGRGTSVGRVRGLYSWEGTVGFFAPMGLDEDAVDLLEVDVAGLVAHGFNERAQAEVASASEQAFAGAHQQSDGVLGADVVAETGPVELFEDEGGGGFRAQARQLHGV